MRLLIAGVYACDDLLAACYSDVLETLATLLAEPLFIWADDLAVLEAVAVLGR